MKTFAVYAAGVVGWLALSAVLGAFGVTAHLLLLLDLGAVVALLAMALRGKVVREAHAFIAPVRDGPSALTPPGAAAEWISGFGTIGVVALLLMVGIDGFALMVGMIGGLVLSSTLLAPALAGSGARTLPDWVEWRFGARARRGALVLFTVFGVLVLWVQLSFAASVTDTLFGMPAYMGVILAAGMVLLCLLGGGMVTVLPAQAMLFIVLCAGAFIPALWLAMSETGVFLPWFASGALLHEIGVAEARLDIVDGFAAHEPLRAMMLGLTGLVGAMALPHTLLRWPVERSAAEAGYFAQRTVALVVLVVAVVPLFAIGARAAELVAALATLTTPDAVSTPSVALASVVRSLDPPAWLLAALGTGAFAAIVASASGATLLAVHIGAWRGATETAGGVLMRLRWTAVCVVGIAVVLALSVVIDPVAGFLIVMFLAASMLLAPLVFGLFWPRATTAGAAAGVVVGGGFAVASLVMNANSLLSGGALVCVGASVLAVVMVSLMGAPNPVTPLPVPKGQASR